MEYDSSSYGVDWSVPDSSSYNSFNNNSFYDTGGSWSDSYSSSFNWDMPSSNSYSDPWYSGVWDFAKTEGGAGLITGLASGAMQGYKMMQDANLADEAKDLSERRLALQEKQMEAGNAAAAAALAYQWAVLNDKIKTRAKHNETINTAPSTPQRAKIG